MVDIFIRDRNLTQRAVFEAVNTQAFDEGVDERTAVSASSPLPLPVHAELIPSGHREPIIDFITGYNTSHIRAPHHGTQRHAAQRRDAHKHARMRTHARHARTTLHARHARTSPHAHIVRTPKIKTLRRRL